MIGISLSAQNVAVKTNLLYDATTTFNLGAEIGLSPRWTLDLSANYNPFSFSDNKKWKHWMAQPEARYWFCERFNGHFMGLHLLGDNTTWGREAAFRHLPSVEDYRYEGYYYGAGLAYGLPVGAGQALGASRQAWAWATCVRTTTATTAHAVMQLNAEDGGHRKFIMVQLPEETDEKSEAYKAGYKNICEIGKERIRRAAKKIHEDNPDATFDDGFRVLKLDDTNMKDVYYAAGDYTQDLVSMLESNVKPDRTDLDLLLAA